VQGPQAVPRLDHAKKTAQFLAKSERQMMDAIPTTFSE
jgi:hypothetical protein